MVEILNALNWRYATKQYDATKKVSDHDLNELLEVMRLAPSSYGVQQWKFIVVKDQKLREELKKVAYGQAPVTDASHLIVLAARTTFTVENIDEYMQSIAEVRGMPVNALDGFKQYIVNFIHGKSAETLKHWNQRQLYIPLGMAIEAAALKNIDSTPMEGFDPAAVDTILGLDKEGFVSTAFLALGYRSSNDQAAHYKKARFPKNKVVEFR
jgi:nitroreductase